MKNILIGFVLMSLVACSQAPIDLPSNVTTVNVGGGSKATQIDVIDSSFDTNSPVDFSKIKMCLMDNVQNDNVTLHDSAGSFLGVASGHYYEKSNTQNIAGSSVIKYVDEPNDLITVTGNVKTPPSFIIDIIKYDLKVKKQGNHLLMNFQNISRAQQSSGTIANDGFSSVGTWSGSRAPRVIETLNTIATRVKTCINN